MVRLFQLVHVLQIRLRVEMNSGSCGVLGAYCNGGSYIANNSTQFDLISDGCLIIVPTLRNLGMDDYDAIIHLWQQAGLHSMRPRGRDSRDAFAAQLAAGQKVIGLEERGQLLGTVVITHDTRKGWVNRLVIHPEHRRRGYAAQLLAAAEKDLRAMGIRVFAVLIEADNMTSQKFFAQEGYKTHDIVYMTKRESTEV